MMGGYSGANDYALSSQMRSDLSILELQVNLHKSTLEPCLMLVFLNITYITLSWKGELN